MKHIKKGHEPTELTTFKILNPNANYSDLGKIEGESLRNALVNEQKGICAFCIGRIENVWKSGIVSKDLGEDDGPNVKVGHWIPQKEPNGLGKNLTLDYTNMLGVCKGGGRKEKFQHCDKKQGNTALTINPLDPSVENGFSYARDGAIYHFDCENDIEKTLNLNVEKLKVAREIAIDEVCFQMKSEKEQNHLSNEEIYQKVKSFWESPDEKNTYREYCQAALYFIENYWEQALAEI
jgi:uncharacterized protein (TIGR02646 family)